MSTPRYARGRPTFARERGGSGLRALLEVLDVAAGQGDPDAVDLDSCVVLELLRLHGGCVLREEDAALSDGGGGAKGEPAPEGRGVESEGDGAESCPPPGKGAGPLLGGGAPPSMPWWARVLRTATLTEATRSSAVCFFLAVSMVRGRFAPLPPRRRWEGHWWWPGRPSAAARRARVAVAACRRTTFVSTTSK